MRARVLPWLATRSGFLAFVALALTSEGCGLKQETFDAQYADAYCALLFQCEDASALAALGWAEESDCVAEIAPTDTAAAADTYDQKAAKACLDALPSVTCDDLANNAFPSACAQVE